MPRKKNVETKVMQGLRKEHLKSGSSLSFEEWSLTGRSDLAEKECIDCNKKCFVIPVSPPDDPDSLLETTGCYVSPYDDGHCFILCDDCCEVLYKEGRLGYSGDGDAFMVRGGL